MASEPKRRRDDMVLNAIFNPHQPLEDGILEETKQVPDRNNIASDEMKKFEIDAVNAAQNGDLILSQNLFNELINKCPEYASAYNNRAQLFRILGDNDSALDDLNKAIDFSQGIGRAASQAFTQRGLIYKLNGDDEKGLEDFKRASKLGNQFAKSQVVAMNPYAALCNQMLGEAFARLYEGKSDCV